MRQARVRKAVVRRLEEGEERRAGHEQGQRERDPLVGNDVRRVAAQQVEAERPDREPGEEDDERGGHVDARERLPAQERAVRPPVEDVERGLERREERDGAPEERDGADDRERRRVLLHRVDDLHDRLDRPVGEDVLEVRDERARRVGLVEEAEDGEREEDQRHEGREREVGHHRGEVSPPLGEEAVEGRTDRVHGGMVPQAPVARPLVW